MYIHPPAAMAADPATTHSLEQTNLVPELHHQPHISAPDEQDREEPPTSTPSNTCGSPLSHHGSHHVHLGFFDPVGVEQLRRRLAKRSESRSRALHHPSSEHSEKRSTHSVSSELTLELTNDGSFDFEKTLRNVIKKLDESDIKRRELGVAFQGLRVVGLGASASYQETVSSSFNPLHLLRRIRSKIHPATRDLLSGFDGVVRPGEMLCVLGRPGSGCTTLLKVLANQRQDYYAVEGDVWYDSLTPTQIEKHYRGDVQYCPEEDVHFPTLTVDQTLRFAASTRTPRARVGGMSRDTHVELFVEVLETLFGLRHVKDTLVGDASVRGVSGGEKKRVSISEALATRSKLQSWDNSTRGLDSSTALEFVQALRIATDIARQSTIVAMYQAGEQLYEHFDKVCLIYEGKEVYYGPANRARQYFIDMGYEPANRQTTADFLVAVTDPNGRNVREGYEERVPRTASEFFEYYRKSDVYRANQDDVAAYHDEFVGKPERVSLYKQSVKEEHAKHSNKRSPYIVSISMQARALMRRRAQVLRGGILTQVIQIAVHVLQAIIMGTVFLRLSDTTQTFFSRGGVLFFALLFAALSTMSEIPALFAQRPIVHRQSRAAMYHPFVEGLALTLVDVPITFITQVIFGILIYFLVGLQQTPGQFFIFFLFVFSNTLTLKAWFRALAAGFKSAAPAQAAGGLSTLILVLYTGYMIPQPYMIGALRWITWINPLRYGFESLMVNEFHTVDAECAVLVPQGSTYDSVPLANRVCTTVGSVPGSSTVDGNSYVGLSFNYTYDHLWRNFGALCAFGAGFVSILLFLTEVNQRIAGESNVILFKRGSKSDVVKAAKKEASSDEEKGHSIAQVNGDQGFDVKAMQDTTLEVHETFSFHHLNYTVPIGKHETRQLLEDVSGYVPPGKLTALMGESGAGKTTLLNALADRTTFGVVTGDRFMNGHPLPEDFQAHTGYCQQVDTHQPTATVREALLFSACLRQPKEVPYSEKKDYVEKVLKMCGLEAYGDAVVGSLGVEHRKRTTIAVELVAKPSLIFLDEPTSGLDSQSAWAITSFLRSLADSGQAIVCTIHQPSAELFQVFDRLLLLKMGGQTVYFGDIGPHSSIMLDYFHRNGARKCGDSENPAEYILEAIGAGATATTNSPEAAHVQEELDSILAESRDKPPVQTRLRNGYPTSWVYQLALLLQRASEAYWRSPTYVISRLVLNCASGLFIGFTFFKAKMTIQGTQNHLFAVFMSLIISVAAVNQMQVPLIAMRDIYEVRERHSRMYSWTALVTALLLVELPLNIFASSLYFLCWYWTVGFLPSRAGFTYFMLAVFSPMYYTSFGQAVGAMSPTPEIAALVFTFLFSFVIIFNGVLQPYGQLGWWQWMYHLSPYTYLIESILGQALGKLDIQCSSVELVTIEPPSGLSCAAYMDPFISVAGGYLANPNATSACQYCEFSSADAFLGNNFNIYDSHHWRDLGFFAAFVCFNVGWIYVGTYIFRIKKGSLFNFLRRLRPAHHS
ncbi:pleiotropic drug resistance ABC transporter [Lentinus tigrinus ALCF2SS1-7]|uniref:Pleiotropic drug resistance ABC transporter n=1 Tax=Lentinus tigrinus ALCF2SS1-6 TaxID=1328759 RepID=A0A5C2SEQ9_9APHY|nr:pleiotropic drug resistance ABC transporter [Lentinus tigrinus ALCF2SS1-6]RPD76121.1 pleiotropic drug resistance ABC transporter [Lentinus tigrinus ALCF2SS1-7]